MALVPVAYGQSDNWYVSGSAVYTNDDGDRRLDDMVGGGQLSLGWDFTDHLTLEGTVGYSTLDGWYRQNGTWVRDEETHFDASVNLLAHYDQSLEMSPYAFVGLGYLGVDYNLSGEENRPSLSTGLGFNWRPIDSSRFSIRGEWRARLAYESDNNLLDHLFTVGVQYDFDGPDLFQRSGTTAPETATQGLYGPWHVSGSVVYFDDDPDRRLDDGLAGLEFKVGWDWTDHLTLEGQLGYSDIDGWYRRSGAWVRDSETHLDISANVLAFYDRNRPFAPYLMAGIGYLGTSVDNGGDENRPSATAGFGFKWRLGQSRFSIRNEYRARLAYEEDYNFVDYIATLGVEYSFGGGPSRRPTVIPEQPDDLPKDTDGDGVLDWWDECPDTPPGVDVTSKGCEIKDMERDADGDRVPDYRDYCPDTPRGAAVDTRGCSLDSDMDGVPTGQDRCPASRPGAAVDEFGCEDDADGDGVLNKDDRCPDTRRGARVDVYGCEITDVIRLPGVNFNTASDRLMPGAENLLRDAARTLNRYPELQVLVVGHTDNVGDPNQNLGLSDRRAKTVLDYLIMYGVDPGRLTYSGYGDMAPIADNSTPEGRAQNRRVELRIIEQ